LSRSPDEGRGEPIVEGYVEGYLDEGASIAARMSPNMSARSQWARPRCRTAVAASTMIAMFTITAQMSVPKTGF